jgi:hypothetical protein
MSWYGRKNGYRYNINKEQVQARKLKKKGQRMRHIVLLYFVKTYKIDQNVRKKQQN